MNTKSVAEECKLNSCYYSTVSISKTIADNVKMNVVEKIYYTALLSSYVLVNLLSIFFSYRGTDSRTLLAFQHRWILCWNSSTARFCAETAYPFDVQHAICLTSNDEKSE